MTSLCLVESSTLPAPFVACPAGCDHCDAAHGALLRGSSEARLGDERPKPWNESTSNCGCITASAPQNGPISIFTSCFLDV